MAKLNQETSDAIKFMAEQGAGVTDILQTVTPGEASPKQIQDVVRWCIKNGYAHQEQIKQKFTSGYTIETLLDLWDQVRS